MIPYFRAVDHQATLWRKIAAGALLAVFLFITVAKFLHSHENARLSASLQKAALVKKNVHCIICDFHLSKDTEAAHQPGALPHPERPFFYSVYFLPFAKSSIGLSYSDRGPPSHS